MLNKSALLFISLFISLSSAIPYLPSNSTPPTHNTTCTCACNPVPTPSSNANSTISTLTPRPISAAPACSTAFPSDVTILNSRYPNYTIAHLQQTTQYIQLRREVSGTGEIATRIQFQNLPSNTTNQTCRLEFVLPDPQLQVITGPNPTFDVYCVERNDSSETVATWLSYERDGSRNQTSVFGTVNGDAEALNKTRQAGGVMVVGQKLCNASMAFDVGLRFDSLGDPNYWAFENVMPPASPVQGFRMAFGC